MKNDNVIPLEKPVENKDLLAAMLRQGVKDLISRAVQAEWTQFLAQYQDVVDDQGRRSVVRNGYQPAREIMTGIGPVVIKEPKTRDKSGQRYGYIWSDGIYFNIQGDEARQCILVIIGITEQGNNEFLAIDDGYRESAQNCKEVLENLKSRGMN